MSSYSSWKVGPIVKLVVLPDSLDELKIIIKTLIKEDINYILAGNATNTLYVNLRNTIIVSTKRVRDIFFLENDEENVTEIIADCGCPLSLMLYKSLKKGLVGFEFSNGIPGTIGGALITNAGANGGTISASQISELFIKNGQEEEIEKEKTTSNKFKYSCKIQMCISQCDHCVWNCTLGCILFVYFKQGQLYLFVNLS